MAGTNINVRVDTQLKEEAERLFDSLGLNMSTAVNMFLKTSVRNQGLPFEITLKKTGGISMRNYYSELLATEKLMGQTIYYSLNGQASDDGQFALSLRIWKEGGSADAHLKTAEKLSPYRGTLAETRVAALQKVNTWSAIRPRLEHWLGMELPDTMPERNVRRADDPSPVLIKGYYDQL